VLEHRLGVRVRNQEGYVIARNGLATEDDEEFSTLHHEPCEFVTENLLNFVSLLDLNAHADGVDRRLDKHSLVLISGDRER
jgi:hypothetical protein